MNTNGFSLVELIVAVAVISILLTVTIVNYTNQRKEKTLFFAARQLAADIRIAQSNAVNVLERGGIIPEGGYGIALSQGSNEYKLFSDFNNDKLYTSLYVPDELISNTGLPSGVVVSQLKKDGGSTANIDIAFTPPFGNTFINGSASSAGAVVEAEIELCLSLSCRIITVNSEGRVTE